MELRVNDRNFQVGDILLLEETRYSATEMRMQGKPLEYTGQVFNVKVSHVLYGPWYGLPDGMCIMSLFGGFLEPESLRLTRESKSNVEKVCTTGIDAMAQAVRLVGKELT